MASFFKKVGNKIADAGKTWGKNTSEGYKTIESGGGQVGKGITTGNVGTIKNGYSTMGKGYGQISEGTGSSGGYTRGFGGGSGFRTEAEFKDANAPIGGANGASLQGDGNSGMPVAPGYISANSLGAAGQLTPQTSALVNEHGGYDAFKNRATQVGPSAWLDMANRQQGLEQANQLDSANNLSASAQAQARSNLAMRGGLRSGSAERIASQGSANNLLARQGVVNQGALTRAGLGVQDEQTKMQLLSQLPGAEQARNAAEMQNNQFNTGQTNAASQFNIGNKMTDIANQNQFNTGAYGTQMSAYGANQTANATLAAGKKKGFFGSFTG